MMDFGELDARQHALLALLERLDNAAYAFTPPTPASHARVLEREGGRPARDLRDVFGWSMSFDPSAFHEVAELLAQAGELERLDGGRCRSRVRAARLAGRLLLHSAYPTAEEDAVFLGPDSYRFAALLERELAHRPAGQSLLDVGAGAGAGAIAAKGVTDARLTLSDVNPRALRLAAVNLAHARIEGSLVEASGLEAPGDGFDMIIANPPYMIDGGARTYRDGGDMHGGKLSLDWARAALPRLRPGGRLVLYTGAAIVGGRDALAEALAASVAAAGPFTLRYVELDPDVFGESLSEPAYADVERIAVVAAVVDRAG